MKLLSRVQKEMKLLGIDRDAKLLVAVSGGIDSMVLLHLMKENWPHISAAHVNFELRGAESDGDENFVRKYCEENKIELFVKHLPIDKSTVKNGVQEAARDLRYAWFEELRLAKGFDYVLTAHHAQDRLETFFINLTRGAGVQGLKSIPSRTNSVLRPFLKAMKSEVENYAAEHHLGWRTDSSNAHLNYLRNRVRHGLIGEFSVLSETANAQASNSMDYLTEANGYFQRATARLVASYKRKGNTIFISDQEWAYLFNEPPLHKYVFDALGFSPDRLDQLSELRDKQGGRMVEGNGVSVYRCNGGFMVDMNDQTPKKPVVIDSVTGSIITPFSMNWKLLKPKYAFAKSNSRAVLDVDKLTFPLELRPWAKGDRFQPVGMKGSKKLSDLFSDLKLSIPEKKNVWVLTSAGQICWVVGYRIDARFKAGEASREEILFELNA